MANKAVQGATYSFTTSGGAAIPAAPTGLAASPTSSTRVDLTWADVASEEGYKVERKLSSSSTWAQIGTTAADVTSYIDTNSGLTAGTGYNYRVRAFTTAGNSGYSNIATVTTPFPSLSPGDVVLYASEALVRVGSWSPVSDASAAGGQRLNNPNAGAARLDTPLANPAHYFEMSFTARPAGPTVSGCAARRLTTRATTTRSMRSSTAVSMREGLRATESARPRGHTSTWKRLTAPASTAGDGRTTDSAPGVLGPVIYFSASGTQTIRVQVREDGFSIDQIVLSPDTFLNSAPWGQQARFDEAPEAERRGGAAAATD